MRCADCTEQLFPPDSTGILIDIGWGEAVCFPHTDPTRLHHDSRAASALLQLTRHGARPRPAERPLKTIEDMTSVDISVAKAAARRLRGKP